MNQTLTDVEFIFVNDGSTDNSLPVLESILSNHPSVAKKIINHSENQGSARARLTGIEYATGKYIGFCDADDWVEPEMFESLYNFAEDGCYDIAVASYYDETAAGSAAVNIKLPGSGTECVYKIISGEINAYLWNKLFKAELFDCLKLKDIRNYWDDICFSIQLFYPASKIGLLNKPLYHYNLLNSGSITTSVSPSKIDEMIHNVRLIESFLVDCNLNTDSVIVRKVRCKSLISATNYRVNDWNSLFPEVNNYMVKSSNLSLAHKLMIRLLNKNRFNIYRLIYALKK